MGDPAGSIWNALHGRATPVVVVYYGDFGLRERAVKEVESIASPDLRIGRASTVEGALSHRDELVMLTPDNERSALEDLEGMRDQILDRKAPIVVFLLRDGDGAKLIPRLPSLSSWFRGNDVDPEQIAIIDEEAERKRFESATGMTPEQWLERYRAGAFADDTQTLNRVYRAKLLER